MRSYPLNSPEAAARVVALTLISDGVASPSEFEALSRHAAAERLGLRPAQLMEVLRHLCEDLLAPQSAQWDGGLADCQIQALLDEVRDPALRHQVLALCVAVAEADAHLSEGEGRLLAQAAQRWGTSLAEERPTSP
jgi:tellurite resistance protein